MTAMVEESCHREAQAVDRLLLRLEVEQFLYQEAVLLDKWLLDEWLALFEPDCSYEVAPLGVDDPEGVSRSKAYFLIGDDAERLMQRVERMKKPSAHVEWPRSKTRHLYSNVLIERVEGDVVFATCNFLTVRSKRGFNQYVGHSRYQLVRHGGAFRIRSKRVILDHDAPFLPQGTVSIFL